MTLTLREARQRGLVEHLKTRCVEMDVLTRTQSCLSDKNGNVAIEFIWELVEKTEVELRVRRGLGPTVFDDIKRELDELDLKLNTRLTDALKREIGAPIKDDDPHEDLEPLTGPPTMPNDLTSLEDLQRKLDATNEAIERTQRKITEAEHELGEHGDRKRALEFAIKHFTTIALALS